MGNLAGRSVIAISPARGKPPGKGSDVVILPKKATETASGGVRSRRSVAKFRASEQNRGSMTEIAVAGL